MAAAAALPALGPANVPNLENVHTKARIPGADYPNLTLRTSGVFGQDVQRGSNEVTEEVVNTNKFLYTGQNFEVFITKLLYFILLNIKQEDVNKYILPGVYFTRLEFIVFKESLKTTVAR